MHITQDWLEFAMERNRPFASNVWIPLYRSHTISRKGRYGYVGHREEFLGVNSVAFPLENRKHFVDLDWQRIGLSLEHQSVAFEKSYKLVEIYQKDDEQDLGLNLALVQNLGGGLGPIWHLNQDLIFALRLIKRENYWVLPDEGFTKVARLQLDTNDKPFSLDIKKEFLVDYLAARKMGMKLVWFWDRTVTVPDRTPVNWEKNDFLEEFDIGRFNGQISAVHEGGKPLGSSTMLLHVSRNDVDHDVDIPIMEPEGIQNAAVKTSSIQHEGNENLIISGKLWCEEFIEPAKFSPRVKRDFVPSEFSFVIESDGTKMKADELNDEDIGRWLWFNPDVFGTLLSIEGVTLQWFTRYTGGIGMFPEPMVHFGQNKIGLINGYAYDIGRLAEYWRKLWAGANVSPEGGICKELLCAQVIAEPSVTKAPETLIADKIEALDILFNRKFSFPLFRPHPQYFNLVKSIHRFRVHEETELFALAKDINRVIVERINVSSLKGTLRLQKNEKLGSLKTLEKHLAQFTTEDEARRICGPLHGISSLRQADSHLPSDDLNEAFSLLAIDRGQPLPNQCLNLLDSIDCCLNQIGHVIHSSTN